jgi:hypothetical protein
MKNETIRTSIDLPRDLHRRLHEKAAQVGCSARRLILEAVERALAEPRPVRPKRRLALDTPIVASRGKPFELTSEAIYDLTDLP